MSRYGFTLIEILLSLALLALIGGMSVPLYQSFQNQNQLTVAATTMTQTLRRAQMLARANHSDSQWGVYIQTGSITLFQGDDFSARDPAFDEWFDIAESIDVSGRQEYTFNKLSGYPEVADSTTLTGPTDNVRTVTLNQEGMIDY